MRSEYIFEDLNTDVNMGFAFTIKNPCCIMRYTFDFSPDIGRNELIDIFNFFRSNSKLAPYSKFYYNLMGTYFSLKDNILEISLIDEPNDDHVRSTISNKIILNNSDDRDEMKLIFTQIAYHVGEYIAKLDEMQNDS